MNILITGSTGLVGHALSQLLLPLGTILTPTREECNLLEPESIEAYIRLNKPNVVLHCAAYTNAGKAEDERGNTEGECYRTNVKATATIVEAVHALGGCVYYISTGSVFHGTDANTGPFEINDVPEKNPNNNNWYGYTKYLGELTNPDAILRISHPIVPDKLRIKDDYLHKMFALYNQNKLYPLFPDQYFPLTDVIDVAGVVSRIIEKKLSGVFHVASPDMVSPYEALITILKQQNMPIDERIVQMPIATFYEKGNSPLRFAKYSALSSKKTMERLGMTFTSWRDIIERVFL